jgi:sodium transport system permease protein
VGNFAVITLRVARKELTELFRDLRSLVITIAVPAVLFPGLFLLLDANMEQQKSIGEERRTVAVAPAVIDSWRDAGGPPSALSPYTVVTAGPEAIVSGAATAAITEDNTILYNDRSEISTVAAARIGTILNEWVKERRSRGGGARPYILGRIASGAGTPGTLLSLAAMVPLFLLLAAAVSALPAALELGAGEKQRQSLEFLLSTTVHGGAVFLGKALAVAITGLLGTFAFMVGVVLATRAVPEMLPLGGVFGSLPGLPVVGIVGIALVLVTLISLLELLLSFLARNSREAQAYFLPLLIALSGVGYTVLFTDVWHLQTWMLHVPVLNLAVLMKAILLESEISVPLWWVYGQNIAIIGVFSLVGTAVLRSEWVLRRS